MLVWICLRFQLTCAGISVLSCSLTMLWSCSLWVRLVQALSCLGAWSWGLGKCFFILLGFFLFSVFLPGLLFPCASLSILKVIVSFLIFLPSTWKMEWVPHRCGTVRCVPLLLTPVGGLGGECSTPVPFMRTGWSNQITVFPPCIFLLGFVLSLLTSILELTDVPCETYYYVTTKFKWLILY